MRLSPALAACGLLALLTWAELLVRVVLPALGRGSWQTSAYWVAPRLVWDGAVDLLWDPVAFGDAAVRLGAVRDMGFLPHPPSGVLPLLPFGLLAELPAFQIWTVSGVVGLFVALVFLLASLRFSATAGLAVVALVPLFRPLRANIGEGQAYIFLLVALLLAGAWGQRSMARRDSAGHGEAWVSVDLLAGLALGALGILKLYYGLVLLLPAFVLRRWVIVATALGAMGAAAALTVVLWGFDGWSIWLDATLSWRARPETVVTAYQTVHSLFGQLFRYEADWNPGPVADLPWVAEILWYAALLAIAGGTLVVFTRHGRTRGGGSIILPLAAAVPVALLLSPVAQDTHYVLMMFPLIVCGRSIAPHGKAYRAGAAGRPQPATLAAWALLALAFVLLAAPWNPNVPDVEGWAALLRYPRVYGALLLWSLLLWLTWRADVADKADGPAREP